jgi:hypothetical protein
MTKAPTKKIEDKPAEVRKIATAIVKPAEKIITSKTGIMIIPGVKTMTLTTLIVGTAPMIAHQFDQKVIGSIRDKHMGKASEGREAKDPEANFEAARYRLSDGGDGVPAGGIKAAISSGFPKGSGVTLKSAKSLRVIADDPRTNLVRIVGPANRHDELPIEAQGRWPRMREDVVRNQTGVVDIRHRPEYWPWAMQISVQYLPSMISASQLLQGIAMAGHIDGLCEWRPGSKESKSGTYGTWALATAKEVELFENGTLFGGLDRILREAAE